MVASISPDIAKPKIIARDRHYIKHANGIVYDTKTGLEWFAGTDKGTTWNKANRWVIGVSVAGGGWQMPTNSELEGIYLKGAGIRNMTPLLETSV